MQEIYNVLIIGAGNIGALYDNPRCKDVLTHAHAFSNLPGYNLLGFVDASQEKADYGARLWDVEAFKDIEEAFLKYRIDLVSVCVSDEYHYDIMKELLNYKVKLIFLEKPITKNLTEAKKLLSLYKKVDTPVLVNYSRRFVDEFDKIKADCISGNYGKFLSGSAYYGKGVVHNGSHLIDFLRYILGEISSAKVFKREFDFYSDDPTVTALLEFQGGGSLSINGVNCNSHTMFEIDMVFEKARVRLKDSGFGLELYELRESEKFRGYKNLELSLDTETSLGRSLELAALNIYGYLQGEQELRCTLEDAYDTMEVCELLRSDLSE